MCFYLIYYWYLKYFLMCMLNAGRFLVTEHVYTVLILVWAPLSLLCIMEQTVKSEVLPQTLSIWALRRLCNIQMSCWLSLLHISQWSSMYCTPIGSETLEWSARNLYWMSGWMSPWTYLGGQMMNLGGVNELKWMWWKQEGIKWSGVFNVSESRRRGVKIWILWVWNMFHIHVAGL